MARAGLLSDTAFLRLWISNTASGLATWALPFVLVLTIMADELSAAYVGLAPAARTFGFIFAMPHLASCPLKSAFQPLLGRDL